MALDERNDEVNQALEARFSQLNAALEAHESKLKAMMVPKDAWVVYHSYEDQDPSSGMAAGEYQSLIGIIKLKGSWRLCHARHYEDYGHPDDEPEWKPIVEASIEDRLRAAKHIDKLREAIVEAKEKLIPSVEEAIAALAKSLAGYGEDRK